MNCNLCKYVGPDIEIQFLFRDSQTTRSKSNRRTDAQNAGLNQVMNPCSYLDCPTSGRLNLDGTLKRIQYDDLIMTSQLRHHYVIVTY